MRIDYMWQPPFDYSHDSTGMFVGFLRSRVDLYELVVPSKHSESSAALISVIEAALRVTVVMGPGMRQVYYSCGSTSSYKQCLHLIWDRPFVQQWF